MSKKTQQVRYMRLFSMALMLLVIFLGAACRWGTGSFSTIGWNKLYLICPLGYLEAMAASKSWLLGAAVPFVLIAAISLWAGRIFCGWVCPVPLTRKLLVNRLDDKPENGGKPQAKGPLTVLGLTLGSAVVFGFPVFCLICPIGLSLATLIAIIRLVGVNEPSFDLVIFPAILVVELVVLRHWCGRFCPVGALLSLLARGQRLFVPRIDKEKCLSVQGKTCGQCAQSCPAGIDLRVENSCGELAACTKCRECAAVCPQNAINFLRR